MARDLQQYAEDALAEAVVYACKGFMDADNAISEIEDIEAEFDGDSYCPYYHQQVEVINEYERDFGNDAEDICGDKQYKATEWQEAQTAYAYAVAYTAHNSYFETAKQELIEAVTEFVDDAQSELELEDAPQVEFSQSCTLGWASHDRELSDGTMIFESRQLDGCNGVSRKVGEVWLSCVVDAAVKAADGE